MSNKVKYIKTEYIINRYQNVYEENKKRLKDTKKFSWLKINIIKIFFSLHGMKNETGSLGFW